MNVNDQIIGFAKAIEARVAEHYLQHLSSLPAPVFSVMRGKKNARIVRTDSGRSVFCFVELATGDILKADGWDRPAKHKRGTVMQQDFGVNDVTIYGAR